MFVKHYSMPPAATKVEKAIFSFKVKVKITRSLTLMSIWKGMISGSMHAKYEVSISYGSKVIAKVKVDNRQTDKQTDRQTNRQTDRQTGQKQYAPDHSIRGHKNSINPVVVFFACSTCLDARLWYYWGVYWCQHTRSFLIGWNRIFMEWWRNSYRLCNWTLVFVEA